MPLKKEFEAKLVQKIENIPGPRLISRFAKSPFIYWSKGNRTTNLNTQFTSDDGQSIACMQLSATYLLLDWKNSSTKYHDTLANPLNIPLLKQNFFRKDRWEYKKTRVHVFKLKHIGKELATICENMQEDKIKILFYSNLHAMAITIKNKREEGFALLFYEPNITLAHKVILFQDSRDVYDLNMNDLLELEEAKNYFLPTMLGVFAFYPSTFHPEFGVASQELTIGEEVNVLEALYIGMKHGLDNFVQEILKHTLLNQNDGRVSGIFSSQHYSIIDLLDVKGPTNVSGLFMAFQEGHHLVVKTCISTIVNLNIDEEQKVSLLQAMSDVGDPGFFAALDLGHFETVKIFIDIVLASNLRQENKLCLLHARKMNNTPGLTIAMCKGHDQIVNYFLDAILSSNLIKIGIPLLMAKCSDGSPALFVALEYDRYQVIQSYMKKILASNISDFEKFNLLRAERAGRDPGLTLALQKGNHESVKVYLTNILHSNFDEDKKVLLLRAMHLGIPGFYLALQNECLATIVVYMETILASKLSNNNKASLLQGKRNNGIQKLNLSKTETLYTQIIHSSALPNEYKELLLNPYGFLSSYSPPDLWVLPHIQPKLAMRQLSDFKC